MVDDGNPPVPPAPDLTASCPRGPPPPSSDSGPGTQVGLPACSKA